MGISRDDAGEFIPKYKELHIFLEDPFKTIDVAGVGWLVHLSASKGRAVNPNLSLSVCGEVSLLVEIGQFLALFVRLTLSTIFFFSQHGGDPESIKFFDKIGLDYVSCSPFRVPVARLAAGQAAAKRHQAAIGASAAKKDRVLKGPSLSIHVE